MSLTNKKGFTLSELLLAAAIFAFAMSGILLMFVNCSFLDQANRNKSIATAHAEFVMEDIMEYMRNNTDLTPISSLEGEIDDGTWNWDLCTICNELACNSPSLCLVPCKGYPCVLNGESITTTYTDVVFPEDPTKITEITVTVNWQDREQVNPRSLELKTKITKR